VRSVAKLSFGVIFKDMSESTLVKTPMNASSVENFFIYSGSLKKHMRTHAGDNS
jgi:hypothetical protein